MYMQRHIVRNSLGVTH